MTKEEIDLSIVIVNYKAKDYLEKCLRSVLNSLGKVRYEIFVVENDSKDGSYEMVKNKFPGVKLIAGPNIGFGPGNNLAMRKAKGRYVLLLNPDTEVIQKDMFCEMVNWMDNHPKVGVSSCALLNTDKSIQGTGGYFPTLLRVIVWMLFLDDIPFADRLIKPYHLMHPRSFLYSGKALFNKSHQQDWLTGAFYMIREKVLMEVGYFDKDFFTYVEEVEYSKRIKDAGWEIWYLPKWKILHHGQASSNSEYAMTSEYKGLKIYFQKHEPAWKMPLLRFMLKIGAILRIIIFGIIKGPKTAKIYVKAFQIA
ncbi:MAG: glycosyltransferase family 2 protein [bacterium]|nr:glycosyltransferase family 2 protein [bacterium]